jgi:hypothetical protein
MKMELMSKLVPIIILLSFTFAEAADIENVSADSIYWTCRVVDKQNHIFTSNQKASKAFARDAALKTCQSNSNLPTTCKVYDCYSEFECHNHTCE